MSAEFDRGLEISETLDLQPKVRSKKEKNYVGEGAKGGRIQVLRKEKKTLSDFIWTAGVADNNQNSATSQLLVSKL